MTKIYDELCAWPYYAPYGMVTAPKVKKPKKPRKSRAKPKWLAPDWMSRTQRPRPPIDMSEYSVYDPTKE
jgi:hypothetical protein